MARLIGNTGHRHRGDQLDRVTCLNSALQRLAQMAVLDEMAKRRGARFVGDLGGGEMQEHRRRALAHLAVRHQDVVDRLLASLKPRRYA